MVEMMAALFAEKKMIERPGGIRIIAITCFLLSLYLAVSGALMAAGMLSFASGRYLLGEYATMGSVIYFIVAIALVVLGLGLQKGWRPTRRLAIVAAGFLLATSLLPISAAVTYFQIVPMVIHGAKIILAVMAIRYLLLRDVVEWFSAKTGRGSTG